MNKGIIIALLLIFTGLLALVWFSGGPRLRLEIVRPLQNSTVTEPFSINYYWVGSDEPEACKVGIGGKELPFSPANYEARSTYDGWIGGSVIGLKISPDQLSAGWHQVVLSMKAGGTVFSDSVRVYYVPPRPLPPLAPKAALDTMLAFFKGPFNDFVIRNYNTYIGKKYRKKERGTEYREAWEGIVNADIPASIKYPIKLYIDRVQVYTDDRDAIEGQEVQVPIDLLNDALAARGLPFYTFLYYHHFPLVNRITDTIHVRLNGLRYPVMTLRQVTQIYGGWTPPTLFGHSQAGHAVNHAELQEETVKALYRCLMGRGAACEDYLTDQLKELSAAGQEYLLEQVGAELKAWFEAAKEKMSVAKLLELKMHATAIHESVHLHERQHGTAVGKGAAELVAAIGFRTRDMEVLDKVVRVEKRICVNLRGQSSEYNAYLTELIFAEGLHRHILTQIYSHARGRYDARQMLIGLAREAGFEQIPEAFLLKRWQNHAGEWQALLMKMLDLPVEELKACALRLYKADFGKSVTVEVE